AVEQGELSKEDIENACRRVLRQKLDLGLFDDKRYPDLRRLPEIVGCAEHRAPLTQAALESIVLLKNDNRAGEAVLPLTLAPGAKIAVVGPNADDTIAQLGDWSFGSGQAQLSTEGHSRDTVVTVLDGLRSR